MVPMRLPPRAGLCLAFLATTIACGDDEPVETPAPTPPSVLVTSIPTPGSSNAPAGVPLVLVFSQPMNVEAGTVDIQPGMGPLSAETDGSWDENDQVLTLDPMFEAGRSYTVGLSGFRDAAGNQLGDDSFVFEIAEAIDSTAPILIGTMPFDGATDVPENLSSIRITFSEDMNQMAGTASVAPGVGLTFGDPTWSSPNVADISVSGLAQGRSYAISLVGFEDLAGNAAETGALLGNGALDFSIPMEIDETPPVVIATTPIEGAPDVDPAITTASFTFSEAMDPARFAAEFSDGQTTVALNGTWDMEQTTVTFTVNLRGDTPYSLTPTGFRDLAGNELDGLAFLGDGKLDFRTRIIPDMVAPRITVSTPADQAGGISTNLPEISVTFDEAMRNTTTEVLLEDLTLGAVTATLTGTWSTGDTVFIASVPGLNLGRTYRIDFRSFQDLAGNNLDPTALGDGFLNFATPPDTIAPAVVSISPGEGADDITPALSEIVVNFDERMDPATLAVTISDGTNTTPLTPTLNGAATEVTYSVIGLIAPDRDYQVNFGMVRDFAGNLLDGAPVLMDGILDFSAPPPPDGFSCTAPLTEPYGTAQASGVEFTIAAANSGTDGAFACDNDGSGNDVVIEYRKRSGDLASGGQLLHVSATTAGSEGLNVQVLSGSCAAGASSTEHKCFWNKDDVDVFLDVPAGTYWIWVSNSNDATGQQFEGATVLVEEVPPALAAGEGCWLPYNNLSPNYTAPMAGQPARWSIMPTSINSFDMDISTGGAGSVSCDDDPNLGGDFHGVDAVVEYTPTQTNSILVISAQSQNPNGGNINMEVLDRCDSTDTDRVSFGCSSNDLEHEVVVTSTSPVYIWVTTDETSQAFPGIDVAVREFVPAAGETCATGRSVTTPGIVGISNTSAERINAPSCLTTNTGPVEWYRYRASGGVVQLTASSMVEVAVINGDGSGEAVCNTDISDLGLGLTVPAGEDICIAVPLLNGPIDFELSDQPDSYSGVGSSTTAVNVIPATAWDPDAWMGASASWIYVGRTSGDLQRFSTNVLTSTSVVTAAEVFNTASQLGRAGVITSADEVFSLDDGTAAGTSRVYRLWDGTGAFAATSWDLTPTYPTEDARAMSSLGSLLLYATHRTGSVDVYSVSTGMAQSPLFVGNNTTIQNVVGIAADQTFVYFVGESVAGGVSGLYRLNRADLASPSAPTTLIFPMDIDTSQQYPIYLDDPNGPTYLYLRTTEPNGIFVLQSPGEQAPVRRGYLIQRGAADDFAWTYSSATNQIFFLETETSTTGRIIQLR